MQCYSGFIYYRIYPVFVCSSHWKPLNLPCWIWQAANRIQWFSMELPHRNGSRTRLLPARWLPTPSGCTFRNWKCRLGSCSSLPPGLVMVAFCHNFALASPMGPTPNGKITVCSGYRCTVIIGLMNIKKLRRHKMTKVGKRGYSCLNQWLWLSECCKAGTPVEVLVDSMTPVKNISRYAANSSYLWNTVKRQEALPDYTQVMFVRLSMPHFWAQQFHKQQKA